MQWFLHPLFVAPGSDDGILLLATSVKFYWMFLFFHLPRFASDFFSGTADYSLLCEVLFAFQSPHEIGRTEVGGASGLLQRRFSKRDHWWNSGVLFPIMHQLTIGDLL